eukprot:6314967-Karenia_brevis.AAC.1
MRNCLRQFRSALVTSYNTLENWWMLRSSQLQKRSTCSVRNWRCYALNMTRWFQGSKGSRITMILTLK